MTAFPSLLGAVRAYSRQVEHHEAAVARARAEGKPDSATWALEVERVLAQSQLRTAQRALTPAMLRVLLLHGVWSVDDLRDFVSRSDVPGAATVIVGELADLLAPHLAWCFGVVAQEQDDRCIAHALLRLVPLALWHGEAKAAYAAVGHWTSKVGATYPRTELDWLRALMQLNAERAQVRRGWPRASLQLPMSAGPAGPGGPRMPPAAYSWADAPEASPNIERELAALLGATVSLAPTGDRSSSGWRSVLHHERRIRTLEREAHCTVDGRVMLRVSLASASRLPGHRRRLLGRAVQALSRLHGDPEPRDVVRLFTAPRSDDALLGWLERAGLIDADTVRPEPIARAVAQDPGFAGEFTAWSLEALRRRDNEHVAAAIIHLAKCVTNREALVALADRAMQLEHRRAWLDGWFRERQDSRAHALGSVLAAMRAPQAVAVLERYLHAYPWARHLETVLHGSTPLQPDDSRAGRDFLRAVAVVEPLLDGRAGLALRCLPPAEVLQLLVRLQTRYRARGYTGFIRSVLASEALASWNAEDLAGLASIVDGDPKLVTWLAFRRMALAGVTLPALLEVLEACRVVPPAPWMVGPVRTCIGQLDEAALTDLLGRAQRLDQDSQALLAAALAELESTPRALVDDIWAFTVPRLSTSAPGWRALACIGTPMRSRMLADAAHFSAVPLVTLSELVPLLHAGADRAECAQLGALLLARWQAAREPGLLQVACTVPAFVAALAKRRNPLRLLLPYLRTLPHAVHSPEDPVLEALLPLLSPATLARLMFERAQPRRDGKCTADTLAVWVHGCRRAYLAGHCDMVFSWLQAQHARLQRLGGVWTLGEHVLDALAPVLHLADVPHWLALFLATYGLPHGPQPAPLAALVARGVALGQPFDTVCAWTASLPPMMRPAAFDTVVATLPRADVLALWDWLLEFDDYPAELQADASPRVHALVQVMQRVPALAPSLVLDRIQRTLDRAAHMDWQDAVTLLLAMAPAVRHLHGENSTRVVVDALRERVLANPLPG